MTSPYDQTCAVPDCGVGLSSSRPFGDKCFRHQLEAERENEGGEAVEKPTANDRQEGGDHYKRLSPEPWDVIEDWGLGYLLGNALKYIARARARGGKADLLKAKHYLDKQIERWEQETPLVDPNRPEMLDEMINYLSPTDTPLGPATERVAGEWVKDTGTVKSASVRVTPGETSRDSFPALCPGCGVMEDENALHLSTCYVMAAQKPREGGYTGEHSPSCPPWVARDG